MNFKNILYVVLSIALGFGGGFFTNKWTTPPCEVEKVYIDSISYIDTCHNSVRIDSLINIIKEGKPKRSGIKFPVKEGKSDAFVPTIADSVIARKNRDIKPEDTTALIGKFFEFEHTDGFVTVKTKIFVDKIPQFSNAYSEFEVKLDTPSVEKHYTNTVVVETASPELPKTIITNYRDYNIIYGGAGLNTRGDILTSFGYKTPSDLMIMGTTNFRDEHSGTLLLPVSNLFRNKKSKIK